ncbi:uncharacterized protein LOC125646303 [Ostrea edulis]|uniref:uncharacterized protein LOC125646303 n=1 Tax=Ostrea edulis TaxID=37623 RepID=UPI0024AF2B12|nr:uncharacterized protein LOC125646303 [Ostrea edulis]
MVADFILVLLVGLLITQTAPAAPTFSRGINVGDISDHRITESSGLASSRIHSNVLYTHNDRGDSSRIFALDANSGHVLAELNINNARNYDWEDIAVGVCPGTPTKSCIYIGDTGDHSGDGSVKNIYVVNEPVLLKDGSLNPIITLHYEWNVVDCETIMVDPSGNVILISKVDGGNGQIGKIPAAAFQNNAIYQIPKSAILNIPWTSHYDPVGGDISPNGREVLLRTHNSLFYWRVDSMDYLTTLSTVDPVVVSHVKEHQGEAVAWDTLGNGYFTCSEGHNQPIYYFRRASN